MAHSSPLTPTQSRSSQLNFGSGPIDEKYITPSLSVVDVSQASPNMMTSIEAKSIRSFIVHTPARSYLYEDPSGDASHWIKSITLATKRQTNVFNTPTDTSNHAVPLTSHYTMPA
jgi:PH domain